MHGSGQDHVYIIEFALKIESLTWFSAVWTAWWRSELYNNVSLQVFQKFMFRESNHKDQETKIGTIGLFFFLFFAPTSYPFSTFDQTLIIYKRYSGSLTTKKKVPRIIPLFRYIFHKKRFHVSWKLDNFLLISNIVIFFYLGKLRKTLFSKVWMILLECVSSLQ